MRWSKGWTEGRTNGWSKGPANEAVTPGNAGNGRSTCRAKRASQPCISLRPDSWRRAGPIPVLLLALARGLVRVSGPGIGPGLPGGEFAMRSRGELKEW